MTILRYYKMQATKGRGPELRAALIDLAAKVAPLAGCDRIELLADSRDPDTLFFVEHWSSIDDHKSAGLELGKDVFTPILAVLSSPPEGRYLEAIPL